MHTSNRKPTNSKGINKEKTSKDDTSALTRKPQEDKLKKNVFNASTPRNFVQKSSTADIYALKKKNNVQATKTPKKVLGTTHISDNVSPMKGLLKSSPSSSVSLISSKAKDRPVIKKEAKTPTTTARYATPRTAKDLPFVNVTVNSPVSKRKIEQNGGKVDTKIGGKTEDVKKKSLKVNKDAEERQRSKTRTLDENEIKVLTTDRVDNNAEMLNLSRKLTAKPKAFYVELDESKKEPQNDKTSEDEVSYEDDFESYESDFESYHESQSENSDNSSNEPREHETDEQIEGKNNFEDKEETYSRIDVSKESKDEEKMLDSGNFELRDIKSANKAKPMQFILEDGEPDVKSSLPDEGFQDMSSNGSSIKTVHTEVSDRPLFIDFTKSKADKRKRKIFERLKQRALDILSMVTLHGMSYSLFEMQPIPYDLYMATFGRSNYTQTAVQTFEDGITEEVQTEEITHEDKWTQHPINFSNHNIYLKSSNKYSDNNEDHLTKFTFLLNNKSDVEMNNQINIDEDYKSNPLRMFFEQKDGCGSTEMLPYQTYKMKLKNTDFNTVRLEKFLKKRESRISHILNTNRDSDSTGLIKTSKYPFSKGYVSISTKSIVNEEIQFIKQAQIKSVVVSDTRNNLIFTIHNKCPNIVENKCVICLWDVSVPICDPAKILVAINSICIARFSGSTNGIFVAALEDGSVQLWDLSEQPTWHPQVTDEVLTDLGTEKINYLPQTERDREWNAKNNHVGLNITSYRCLLQACAYTTSASSMESGPNACITGLVVETLAEYAQDGGRRVIGRVCALQRIGVITIWSIIQEKLKNASSDLGRAYWSKMKLEKKQVISLLEHINFPISNSMESIFELTFNLNAAKRRTSVRKKEKSLRRQYSRPKSGASFDSNRPSSAAITKNNITSPMYNWEDGLLCNDLKIMRLNNNDNYLVAKNCGEVLCCTKNIGVVKVNRFCIATDLSTVTCIEVSPHSLPYFLAATDSGTVNICSMLDQRVLLTLDTRNGPPTPGLERYQVDSKGRFLGSACLTSAAIPQRYTNEMAVKSVIWCRSNPCCIVALQENGALLTWDLTQSDIHAISAVEQAATSVTGYNSTLALVSSDEEVQVHNLPDQSDTKHLLLFQKYATLL